MLIWALDKAGVEVPSSVAIVLAGLCVGAILACLLLLADSLGWLDRAWPRPYTQPDQDQTDVMSAGDLGSKIYRGVTWSGESQETGGIFVDGPFCVDDETRLRFRRLGEYRIPLENDRVGPMPLDGVLKCPNCPAVYTLASQGEMIPTSHSVNAATMRERFAEACGPLRCTALRGRSHIRQEFGRSSRKCRL